MFSDTDCDLIATLPLTMVCAVLRAGCVIWKSPITDVLFQLWLLPLHIHHSWSLHPDPLVPFTIPQTQIPHWNTLNKNLCRYLIQLHSCYRCKSGIGLHLYMSQAENPAEFFPAVWISKFDFIAPNVPFWSLLPLLLRFTASAIFCFFSVNPIWIITAHAADSNGHHWLEIAECGHYLMTVVEVVKTQHGG